MTDLAQQFESDELSTTRRMTEEDWESWFDYKIPLLNMELEKEYQEAMAMPDEPTNNDL